MADNDDIQAISGELLPATANLVEVTRSLQAQNAAMMMGGGSSSDDPTIEIRSIFLSMDKTLTRISNDIKDFTKNISKMFDSINQNHIQLITIQQESLENEEEQLLLNREQAENEEKQLLLNEEQAENEEQTQKKQNLQGAEAKREGSKSFVGTFAKDLEESEKEFAEKGFTKYIADLMGVGGVIEGALKTTAQVSAIFTGLGKSMLGFIVKIPGVMKAVTFVKTAYLALQAKVLVGLTKIGTALMSFVRNPIGAIVKAITFIGTAFTVLGAKVMVGITAIGTGLTAASTAVMTFISATLLPGITAIAAALAPLLVPAALIVGGLIAAYQFFEGFLDGFTEDAGDSFLTKTIKGLTRGIGQIVDLFVAWPLDLIKDLVSWIANALGFEEFSAMLDSFSFSDFYADIFKNIENFFINLGDEISTFFSELFDFSKIRSMLTNLFAEIGVPRIEFDVPVIGKVGFGPFYPFMPDTNVANVKSSDSLETVSTQSSDGSIDTRERTSQEGITVVEGAMTGKYARGAQSSFVTKESIDATSGEEITEIKQKKVLGQFDTETGEGTIVYQTRDADNELNNVMQEYKVTGVTFGQVRRLVDDGASPDEVRMFLENKQKSIFDKIGDFFSSPAETAPINVAPAETKRADITQELGTQTTAREEAKADQQSQQAVNVVNAPTSNVSNVSQSSAYFDSPSAVDGLSMSY